MSIFWLVHDSFPDHFSWLTTQNPGHEEHLYHYTSAETLERIVTGGTLKFGTLSSTNDPAENKEWVAELFFSSLHTGSTVVGTDDLNSVIQDIDRLLRRNACLACFTLDRLPHPAVQGTFLFHLGWARARMWHQYGDRHEGACMVFNRMNFLESMDEANSEAAESRERSWGRVQYFDQPKDFKIALDAVRRRGLADLLEDFRTATGMPASLYFRKNTDWESEQEFRAINIRSDPATDQDDQPIFVPYGKSLEAVILGEHYVQPEGQSLWTHLSEVPTYRCVWLDGAPTLESFVP